jgi:hypothetical protein
MEASRLPPLCLGSSNLQRNVADTRIIGGWKPATIAEHDNSFAAIFLASQKNVCSPKSLVKADSFGLVLDFLSLHRIVGR